jgi:HEPN domain-containing protein
MPHDPSLVAETRDWLIKASQDLEAAERLLTGGPPLPSHAAFNAQQAAEKAQKAFLTWHKHPFTKTHDLGALGGDCVAIDPTLSTVSSAVAPISGYAVEPRYPGPWANQPLPRRKRQFGWRERCTRRCSRVFLKR